MNISGHCNDNIHRRCTWPPCTCTCGHKGRVTTADDVQEMVAQTFDEGHEIGAIPGRIGATTKAAPAVFAHCDSGASPTNKESTDG